MSTETPKITTSAQLAILKALVRSGELAASKIKKSTGNDATLIMDQLAANGWKFSFMMVPALKTHRPLGVKPVYVLNKAHRKLAAKLIDKREEGLRTTPKQSAVEGGQQ